MRTGGFMRSVEKLAYVYLLRVPAVSFFILRAISYMPQQNYAATKVEHSEKVLSVSFVADN